MKVFISWSGDMSGKVADAWHEWLSCVIPNSNVFVSSHIDKGARWPVELAKGLEDTDFGLVCLTKENWANPWINFEAGALSKRLEGSKCMTFLFNLKVTDIVGPLAQFQHTKCTKEEIRKMILDLNNARTNRLEPSIFDKTFDKWWPDLDSKLKNILTETPPTSEKQRRPTEDILEEVLELARRMDNRFGNRPSTLMPSIDLDDDLYYVNKDLLNVLSILDTLPNDHLIANARDKLAATLERISKVRSAMEHSVALQKYAAEMLERVKSS